jgi:exonuclease SbcD
MKAAGSAAWIELEITSRVLGTNLTAHFDELIDGSKMEILRIKDMTIVDRALAPVNDTETLENLSGKDVFNRCLQAYEITEDERSTLLSTYEEAIQLMENNDSNAI